MKVVDIVNSVPVINELMTLKMKISVSYKLKKIADEASIVLDQFNEARTELLTEFGTLDEAGTKYNFADGNEVKFTEALNKYVDDDVKLTTPTISLAELDGVEIEPNKIGMIMWFLDA